MLTGLCFCGKSRQSETGHLVMCDECIEKLNGMWKEFLKEVKVLGDARLMKTFADGIVRHLLPPGSMPIVDVFAFDEPRILKVQFDNANRDDIKYARALADKWDHLMKEVFGQDVELVCLVSMAPRENVQDE